MDVIIRSFIKLKFLEGNKTGQVLIQLEGPESEFQLRTNSRNVVGDESLRAKAAVVLFISHVMMIRWTQTEDGFVNNSVSV